MARHRDVRNLDSDDYDNDFEYGSSFGSYCEEVPLSSSVEQDYMFRRNASGTTPKLTHFMRSSNSVSSVPEEDETDEPTGPPGRRIPNDDDSDDSSVSTGPTNRRHPSGSSLLEALDEEETRKLSECLEQILDIVGESMPEIHVKEAIVKCDFNVELALNTLLNNPGAFHTGTEENVPLNRRGKGRQPQPTIHSPPPVPGSLPENKPSDKVTSGVVTTKVEPPFPDVFTTPVVQTRLTEIRAPPSSLNVSAIKPPPNKKRIEIRERSRTPSPASQPSQPGFSTPVGGQQYLSTPTAAQSASINLTPASTPSSSTIGVIKMRKKEVNAAEEYAKVYGEDGTNKCLLNLVVVGHVDSGKSTLMGHLLFLLGCVSSRVMHKYEQDSRKVGKQSFAYAWVLDETDEERSRGITMDVGQNRFETKTKSVTLLDAPGHRDFIPNMISGAYQADVAILVVNSTRGEFEAGFEAGGQTREHALLVRSLGVTQLVVAVNKLDTVGWSQERFDEIVSKLKQFLKQVGFKEADVRYVPCSGLTGENLKEKVTHEAAGWCKDRPTLLEAIDTFAPPQRLIEKPFRLSISDVYKPSTGGTSSGFCVAGRIESGFVLPNDRVLIMPASEYATVKVIARNESGIEISTGNQVAFAGEHVSLILTGIEQANISNGMVVCDPQFPIPVTKLFRAKIVVFNIDIPIIKGTTCVLHYGSVQTQATVKKLIGLVNKATGDIMTKPDGGKAPKPRCLGKNTNAVVEIATETPICLELYSNIKELGRFMLRSGGKTIAAGMAVEIF